MRLVENQAPEDFLIYNIEDEFCRDLAETTAGKAIGFGVKQANASGLWVEDGWIMTGGPLGDGHRLMPVGEIRLKGIHNTLDVMAAAGAALVLGDEAESVRAAVRGFEGLEHRMEFVRNVADVSFYNDSKATNPHAALSAVKSFDEPMAVIMGGRNKGLSFDELASELCRRFDTGQLKGLVLLGECAPLIQKTIGGTCETAARDRVEIAEDMDGSVRKAFQLSHGGGVVLFSPACASFDMFDDYGDRGRVFKDSVNKLEEK
jgi:UDP-N-acetylmuramoylalanine--D-glutamate ligase